MPPERSMQITARVEFRMLVVLAAVVSAGLNQGCQRQSDEGQRAYWDLNKASAKNICPGGTPELPQANLDVRLLFEQKEFPPGEYQVIVYRSAADSPRNVGNTGTVTAEDGAAALRVKLRLDQLEPGPHTLSIGTWPNVKYCDVHVK
jgi:hypothetical protein